MRPDDKFSWLFVIPLDDPCAVDKFLCSVGTNLPAGLRACLATNNAGTPSIETFSTVEGGRYAFKALFSYNAGDAESIDRFYPLLVDACALSYPIALEAAGDVVCYDEAADGFVLIRHETGTIEVIDASSNPALFASLRGL